MAKDIVVKMSDENGVECPVGIVVPFWVLEYAEYSEQGGERSLLSWLAHEAQISEDQDRSIKLQSVFFEIVSNQ